MIPRRLTERQQKLYLWMRDQVIETSRMPTVRQVMQQVGSVSPNAAMGFINALIKKGLIEAYVEEGGLRRFRLTGTVVQVPEIPQELLAESVDTAGSDAVKSAS